MPGTTFPLATYIDTADDLQRLADELAGEPLLAVDTESNSLHAYQERVCLIQLSTRRADYIVDPLQIPNLDPLAPLMASPDVQKIFHAAEYDIMCMKRDFGFEFCNLFDTMTAARVCGFKSVGLGSLLQEYAGIRLDKKHQLDNWGQRPLPASSLKYAQADTHYLPMLRDEFMKQLQQMGRLEEAREVFEEICRLDAASYREFDPDGFWRIGLPNMLNTQELQILRELYRLREDIAQEEDRPPFRVLSNNMLIGIARNAPASARQLRDVREVGGRHVRHYGDRILSAVQRGLAAKSLPERPQPPLPDPVISERYTALHTWRKSRANQRGVESDIIISKQALWDMAHQPPTCLDELRAVPGVGPWRLRTYGQEILAVLRDFERVDEYNGHHPRR
ncbi:MAG: ribonuclease D [Phototrophicaceae bacterium]